MKIKKTEINNRQRDKGHYGERRVFRISDFQGDRDR